MRFSLFRRFTYEFHNRWKTHSEEDRDILIFADNRQQSEGDLSSERTIVCRLLQEIGSLSPELRQCHRGSRQSGGPGPGIPLSWSWTCMVFIAVFVICLCDALAARRELWLIAFVERSRHRCQLLLDACLSPRINPVMRLQAGCSVHGGGLPFGDTRVRLLGG
jgi:hypothetical protein